MKSFLSKKTILELFDSSALSDDQISREFDRISKLFTNHDDITNITQTADKASYIATHARILIDNNDIHECKDFSHEISDLKQSIDNLSKRICVSTVSSADHEHFTPHHTEVESDHKFDVSVSPSPVVSATVPGSFNTPAVNTSSINGISKPFELLENARNDELDYLLNSPTIPYIKYSNCNDFVGPDYCKILSEQIDYNYKLNGRHLAYYGECDYRYTGARHAARPISDSRILDDMCTKVRNLFPSYKFNSVLVSRYANGEIKCPAHSDDERDIARDSLILTISFGAKRSMHVRKKMEFGIDELDLSAGDIVFMSKASQVHFDHAIPPTEDETGERVSCTFRLIEPSTKYIDSKSSVSVSNRARLPETVQEPKRILILSDSKNLGFDPSDFKNPAIACFKEACYTIDNIRDHEHKIAQADVILISTGVNDILRGKSALDIFLKLRRLMEFYNRKFPEKMFLFYAISEVTGRYEKYNDSIEQLNDFCFQMSLRLSTFKLFNNVFFNLYTHLASDGLHLSKYGKWSASVIWTQAALCALHIRKAALPLRPRYLKFREEFLARSSSVWAG